METRSIFRDGLFDGQVAIVTGGGSGIGRCIARELAFLGARVILASRDGAKLEGTKKEIEASGGAADAIPCNIRSEDEVRALVDTTLSRHGRVDCLVNNSGGQFMSPAEMISTRGWNAVIETNLTGAFLMCREVMSRHMRERGGAIVNIVADMWRGMPYMAHSGAARAGVVNLTKSLALEWSACRIRVNAVAPGVIASSGLRNYPEAVREAIKTLPPEIPANRLGTEAEVSAAVVFLLSPAAAYITGATLPVDGALSLYRHPYTLPAREPQPSFAGFSAEDEEAFR